MFIYANLVIDMIVIHCFKTFKMFAIDTVGTNVIHNYAKSDVCGVCNL